MIEFPTSHFRQPGMAPSGCRGGQTFRDASWISNSRTIGFATKLRRSAEESIRLALNDSTVCMGIEMSFCVSPRPIQKSRIDRALKPRLRRALSVGRRRSPHPSCSPDSIEERIPDVENPPSKIFFFIDDFQYISGFNEKGIIDPDVNQDLYIKSADNICKILRSIVDDYKTSIVLVISTYPGIFKVSEHMKRLTDTRYSEKISIDKYEDEVETEELFIESLKVLNEDNIWKQVYYNGDKDVIKKIILDKNYFDELQINRLQDIFYNNVKDNEIEDIVDIVHDQSEGRPSYIKPLLAEIYELYQKPILANDLTLIIDYKDNEKMQKIYKNIGNEFGDNEIYKILGNYTPEQKFHLYLFLNNSRLTVEEISQLLNLSRARFILKNFCQNEYNIKDVALETIDSDDTFFGDYKDDISNITNEKLKKSIKQFKKDQLINYNTDDSIKTVHKLRLIDFNYVITHLKTFGFPNIYNRSNPIGDPGGSGSFFQTLIPMLGSMGYHRPSPLPLRPDLNENEQIENISNFIQTMTEVRNLSDINIEHSLAFVILEYYASSKSNRERNMLFSQETWLELFTIVNTKVDTTGLNIAILKGNLRRQAIDKLVDYSDTLIFRALGEYKELVKNNPDISKKKNYFTTTMHLIAHKMGYEWIKTCSTSCKYRKKRIN